MRFRTKPIADNRVRHSYYVSFLLYLGEKLFSHGEEIVRRRFI